MSTICNCPHCGQACTIEDPVAGAVACPHCGAAFDPAASSSADGATLVAASAPSAPSPIASEEDLLAATLRGEGPPPSTSSKSGSTADLAATLKGPVTATRSGASRVAAVSAGAVSAGGEERTMLMDKVDDAWGATLQGIGDDGSAGMTIKQEKSRVDIQASRYRVAKRAFLDPKTPARQAASDYQILSVLGQGGMGVVYTARQSAIDRQIALKMIKGDAATTPGAREKFLLEAVVTGDLEHPNIVPVYDLGENEQGQIFYAMKQVKGTPWNKAVEKKELSENLDILTKVADAIAFAHSRGVIHRDLKPENVMLGEFGEVVVMDWGLAASLTENGKAEILSKQTAVCGTPAYLAPEMALGDASKIGVGSDIYLLGAILYEIVTGLKPHAGRSVLDCIYNAAANRIQPSSIGGELVEIALKAMATEPKDRYPDAKAFQKALQDYKSHFESIALSDKAQKSFEEAEENGDYQLFSRAVFGFREALGLWDGNEKAAAGAEAATFAYAACALEKGDLDLAADLLRDAEGEAEENLAARVTEARAERNARARRIRFFKAAAGFLLVVVLAVMGGAYAMVSKQMALAVEQKNKAEAEEKKAVAARDEAKKQRDEAERQKAEVEKQKTEVEKQKTEAETQRTAAVESEKRAKAQEVVARAREKEAQENLKKFQAEQQEKEAAKKEAATATAAKDAIERLRRDNWWILPPEKAAAAQTAAAVVDRPARRTLDLPNGAKLELALIPPGEFGMGSPEGEKGRAGEESVHAVVLTRAFYLGTREVTRAHWQAITGEVPPGPKNASPDWPATGVSDRDIREKFLPRLAALLPAGQKVRLPTEAEWEYAARAGANTAFAAGADETALAKSGWYIANANGSPRPAGTLAANAWGLLDMHGNAAEICEDAYEADFYGRSPGTDPLNSADAPLRVVRGGGWAHLPEHCRSAYRLYAHRENRYDFLGFRIAVVLPE